MAQAVVIKSKSYGIHLVLNPELEFQELLDAVISKFQDAGAFFKNAKVGISFEGYNLSVEQEYMLIDAIQEHTTISVVCIMEEEKIQEACMLAKAEAHIRERIMENALCHYGSLSPGETLQSETGVVIIGNVPTGAKVIAAGNIIVFGELKGFAQAGLYDDSAAYIAALSIDTGHLQIGSILFIPQAEERKEKTGLFRRKKTAEPGITPQIARVLDGHVIMEPCTKDLL